MDEKELQRLAVEELLKEAERGRERYKTMGPRGWRQNLIPLANKRFLRRTITSTLHANRKQAILSSRTSDEKSHVRRSRADRKTKSKASSSKNKSKDSLTLKYEISKRKCDKSVNRAKTSKKQKRSKSKD